MRDERLRSQSVDRIVATIATSAIISTYRPKTVQKMKSHMSSAAGGRRPPNPAKQGRCWGFPPTDLTLQNLTTSTTVPTSNMAANYGNPLGKSSFEQALASVGLVSVSVPEPCTWP